MRKIIIISMVLVFMISCGGIFNRLENVDQTAWRDIRTLNDFYVIIADGKPYVIYEYSEGIRKVEAIRDGNKFAFTIDVEGKPVNYSGNMKKGIYMGVKRDNVRSLWSFYDFAKMALYEITGIKDFFIMFRLYNVKPEDFPSEVKLMIPAKEKKKKVKIKCKKVK